jgi:hypothetical protein
LSFCNLGKDNLDFDDQITIILRDLLFRFNDDSPGVLKAAHGAFSALSTYVPAEELVKHIEFIHNLIASMVSDARRRKGGVGDGEFLLPGFNIPKGQLLPARAWIAQDEEHVTKTTTRHLHGGQRLVFLIAISHGARFGCKSRDNSSHVVVLLFRSRTPIANLPEKNFVRNSDNSRSDFLWFG